MDPLTQGLLGATAARNFSTRQGRNAALVSGLGFLAGMAADLHLLNQSDSDPLLFLEYHRQFTHSLIFIPLGGLLCGMVLYALFARHRLNLWQCIGFCTAGYATHALLDACTTYGTQLLWPFSNERIAWNVISIIDPVYTLPIALLCLLSLSPKSVWAARLALFWVLAYPTAGWWQRERVEAVAWNTVTARGQTPVKLEAKPAFANLLLWKTVYLSQGHFYVDAVRCVIHCTTIEGDRIAALDLSRDLPWLPANSVQAIDVKRFSWFSKNYVALDPNRPNRVIDIRYSLLPHEIDALWSIDLNPAQPGQHVQFQSHRSNGREKLSQLWQMLKGE